LAAIIAIGKNKGKLADVDLREMTIHLVLLVSFAILMSPAFDQVARTSAQTDYYAFVVLYNVGAKEIGQCQKPSVDSIFKPLE